MADELESTTGAEAPAESTETTAPAESGSTQPAEGGGQAQDTFFDPKTLPPELQGTWKRMQGAYTRKMQQFAANRDKADLVDRFNTDPAVRRQILQQYAHELGLQVNRGEAADTGAPKSKAPAEFVENFRSNLPQELKWMAESLAGGFWDANQASLAPMQQQLESQLIGSREQEFDSLAADLPPGWEEHEDEMSDLLDFLQGSAMRHPVFGSKPSLLYQLVTGQAMATTQAIERMGQAAQNRMSSSRNGARVQPNIAERIMKTRNISEAIRMAGEAAMADMEAKGARFE